MSECSSHWYYLTGTDLAPPVRYPTSEADHTTKLVEGCQRYKEAEGRSLTETHKDDATRVDATMDLSLDPCLHAGDRGRYGILVPLVPVWWKRSDIEPTCTVLARIQTHRPSGPMTAVRAAREDASGRRTLEVGSIQCLVTVLPSTGSYHTTPCLSAQVPG